MMLKTIKKRSVLMILIFLILIAVVVFVIKWENKVEKNNFVEKNEPLQQVCAVMPNRVSITNYDFSDWNNSCKTNLVVINKNNKVQENFNLSLCKHDDRQVHTLIKADLDNMLREAKKDGINLRVSSGYRSPDTQKMLFDEKVAIYLRQKHSRTEAEELASASIARPYTSEHQTGLAVDINGVNHNFNKTEAFKWLINNAADYGFVLRYDSNKTDITHVIYEPWHFRYVGATHAHAMYEKNMCLEEYVAYLINK